MSALIIITLATIITLCVVVCLIIRVNEKNTNAVCKSKKRLDGKTVLVTGGTAGMGLEVSREFARRGARVIIACPFPQEGAVAKKTIVEDTGNQDVLFKLLDLSSLSSVHVFANNILKTEKRLDILMNNAGVLTPGDFATKDGMNFVMQVNYFGLFLLTLLLLPLLKKTGTPTEPTRIINVSSVLHNVGTVDIKNMNRVGYWLQWKIYCNSKLCVAMFTRTLSSKLSKSGANVVVNSVDPGAVGTRIYDSCGKLAGSLIRILFGALFKDPWEGAQTSLHVALDDQAGAMSGEFFKNCKLSRAVYSVYDEKLCSRLWDETFTLVKINEFVI